MNKKTVFKALLDLIMTILFVLMFDKMVLGMTFHEIGGLAVCVFFLIHKIVNWNWITAVSKKMFSKNFSIRLRICYIVDVLLLIVMALICISGILISKTVLVNISSHNMVWKMIHKGCAPLGLLLVGIHVGLHWTWVMNVFVKVFHIVSSKKTKVAALVLTIIVIITGIISINQTRFIQSLYMPLNIFSTSAIGSSAENEGNKTRPNMERERPTMNLEDTGENETSDSSKNTTSENEEMTNNKLSDEGHNGPNSKISISNVFSVVIKYISITSVFAAIVYYISKFFTIRRKKIYA